MTADRRAALVEEMCRAVANAWDTEQRMQDGMSAALDLALEEAAKIAFRHGSPAGNSIAATIRAMKGERT